MSSVIQNKTFDSINYLSDFPVTDYSKSEKILSLPVKAFLLEVYNNKKVGMLVDMLGYLNNLVLLVPIEYNCNHFYIYNNDYMILVELTLTPDKLNTLIESINNRKDMHASLTIAGDYLYSNDEDISTTIANYVYKRLIILDERSVDEFINGSDTARESNYNKMYEWYKATNFPYSRFDKGNMSEMLDTIIHKLIYYQKAINYIVGEPYKNDNFLKKLWFKFLSFF